MTTTTQVLKYQDTSQSHLLTILITSGERFDKRKSPLESWVAVFVEADWRLVDPLLGAGQYEAVKVGV